MNRDELTRVLSGYGTFCLIFLLLTFCHYFHSACSGLLSAGKRMVCMLHIWLLGQQKQDKKLQKSEPVNGRQADEQPVKPELEDRLPENFPVSVIMQSRPAKSKWLTTVWEIIAITVGSRTDSVNDTPKPIHSSGDVTQYICNGLTVALYKDECESYYHNLMSPNPRCYVVTHIEDYDQPPDPFLVTMSFDEAHAYLEGEDDIFDVDVPPELYRWTEAFVLVNYAPEKRIKRKRKDWKQQGRPS